jgi:hypothetical protein
MIFNKKVLRETRLISALSHENIVNYYSSWLEFSVDNPYSIDIDNDENCVLDHNFKETNDNNDDTSSISSCQHKSKKFFEKRSSNEIFDEFTSSNQDDKTGSITNSKKMDLVQFDNRKISKKSKT